MKKFDFSGIKGLEDAKVLLGIEDEEEVCDILLEEGLIASGCAICEIGPCDRCVEVCKSSDIDICNPWGDSTVDPRNYPCECLKEWGLYEEDVDDTEDEDLVEKGVYLCGGKCLWSKDSCKKDQKLFKTAPNGDVYCTKVYDGEVAFSVCQICGADTSHGHNFDLAYYIPSEPLVVCWDCYCKKMEEYLTGDILTKEEKEWIRDETGFDF